MTKRRESNLTHQNFLCQCRDNRTMAAATPWRSRRTGHPQ